MTILLLAILALGALTAILHWMLGRVDDSEPAVVQPAASCATCTGTPDTMCEQECMMEAATKDIQYFDDEELDKYRGYASCQYTDEEAEEFREVMYTMKPEEVKEWNRSLILREINVPDKIKDELVMLLGCMLALFVFASCSTQKNTAQTRWWHSFNARYNTMYNGHEAYRDADEEKLSGNVDNYTELLPMYMASNKNSKDIGKANYDRAIEKSQKAISQHSIKKRPIWKKSGKKTEKDIEWLARKEYNPYIWRSWYLMGRSQFQKGEFDEAAATFSYMSRLYHSQPAIDGRARAWLARSYAQQDWLYDAEDVITKMKRDSIDWHAMREWNATMADFLVRSNRYQEALPYLLKTIKQERRPKLRARLWFIKGQLEQRLGNRDEAYRSYARVIRLNPPYQLEFNARIAQTEVMAHSGEKKMISRLKAMARNGKNADYLDQVYYAMGNIHMLQRDTASAIAAYEKGNSKATRAGVEKGVLLLTLGNLYWELEKYSDAKRCYGEAIGLLDKDRKDYQELDHRSKVLDELVPHTDNIHLQDSLLALSVMPEAERLAAIDRVIDELKKKEREEEKRKQQEEAEQQRQDNEAKFGTNNRNTLKPTVPTSSQQREALFYFYNPQAVSQGKQTFAQQWGKRANEDDWQRLNHTVVNLGDAEGAGEEAADGDALPSDSTSVAETPDKEGEEQVDPATDPHNREYYLAQIPFSDEQKAEAHNQIKEALFQSGVIFKDKLENLSLAAKQLDRIEAQYADYEKMPDVYYHDFLLYSRLGDTMRANGYIAKLQSQFADNDYTKLLTDPYFEENARFGVHLEDSLYAVTYDAFKAGNLSAVAANAELSESRFPLGQHRDKFLFVNGMRQLNEGNGKACEESMKTIVEKYSKSDVAELAGMILKGVQSGRRLYGGSFDLNSIWDRRVVSVAEGDSTTTQFSDDRNASFVFMLVYQPDSLDENKLLYEVARYNFTTFMVRNFDMELRDDEMLRQMLVSGFRNYDEALQYARSLYAPEHINSLLRPCRPVIISEQNLSLLGTHFSYNDYRDFYDEHFAPLPVSKEQLLNSPAEVVQPLDPDDLPADEEYDDSEDYEDEEYMDDLDRLLYE